MNIHSTICYSVEFDFILAVRELFEDLDEAQIESTIREASLETSEYNKIKQDFMKICQPSTS